MKAALTRGAAVLLAAALCMFPPGGASALDVGEIYVRPFDKDNQSYKRQTILWQGAGFSGKTVIVYGVEGREGRIAVCGLVLNEGRIDRRALRGALANSGVAVAGREILTDLQFFREFIEPDALLVACRLTNYAWRPAYGARPAELVFRGEFTR